MEKISIQMVRQMLLAAQGLDRITDTPAAKADVLRTIEQMGVLQIDTIHVVARSPYLTLWSRLGAYDPAWLDELLAEGALFEYWSHAMCFLPIEDYPLYRRSMLDFLERRPAYARWADEHPEAVERVRSRLRENGEARSAEFDNPNHIPGGWWNWKDEKIALEYLLLTGEIMVKRRHNFHRIYTLRERRLPDWNDGGVPTVEEVRRELTLRSVYALGIAAAEWIPDYYRLPKKDMPQRLKALARENALIPIEIDGINSAAYLHPERLALLGEAQSGQRAPVHTTLLSPFDPLVWDRQRGRDLFAFDYTIECYTPAAKRRYGYFTLPILQRGCIVGRLDPKAHRAQGLFEVKALHLEPGVRIDEQLVVDLAGALRRLADWHATPEVVVRQSNPPELAQLLNAACIA